METQSGPSLPHSVGTGIPVVAVNTSKTPSSLSTRSAEPSKIEPIFARDLLGYLFLCCKADKERAETRSFSPLMNAYSGLTRALNEATSQTLKDSDTLKAESLKKILTAANISVETWNATVRQIGAAKNGRMLLEQANSKGEAVSLGLPEDSSKQLREAEKRFLRDNFDGFEMARLIQLSGDIRSKAKKTAGGQKIVLYQIKTGPGYAIPADGFEKYTAPVFWCACSALIKLKGFLSSLFKDKQLAEQDPVVQTARNRTWLQPVGLSVKSPTIQALVKQMANYHVQTEIKPISDRKGYILEFTFTVKPGHLPVLTDKLRNL